MLVLYDVRAAFMEHGGGTLGIIKVAALHLENIKRRGLVSASHVISCFSFLIERSRR